MKKVYVMLFIAAVVLLLASACEKKAAYKALIITGQDDEGRKVTSANIKEILEQTNLFNASILSVPSKKTGMEFFSPGFNRYNIIVLDYKADEWPKKTKKAFTDYISNGGGAVICQSAGNAIPGWKKYSEICGFTAVPGSKGKTHEYEVRTRNSEHPVTKGLPVRWLHASDILQNGLSGPEGNCEVLATSWSDSATGGSGRNEPVLIAVRLGKGRILHTTMGYAVKDADSSITCTGYITTLQRGAEWAAAGNVTQAVPFDFPSAATSVIRPGLKQLTIEDDFAGISRYEIGMSTKYLTDIEARIRAVHGNTEELSKIEKMIVDLLKDQDASVEGKKLLLNELSWMGTGYCVPVIKELASKPELKDEAEFALERLKTK